MTVPKSTLLALLVMSADVQASAQELPRPEISELPEATLLNAQTYGERLLGNFPSAPLRVDYQGTVRIMVRVDVIGRARDCQIIESSGNSIIDTWACRGTERYARFAPATNDDGEPVESKWSNTFAMTLGDPSRAKTNPEPLEP